MDWRTIHQHSDPEWALRSRLDLQDVWIGLYWTVADGDRYRFVYVCLLPCLPVRIEWPPPELRHD